MNSREPVPLISDGNSLFSLLFIVIRLMSGTERIPLRPVSLTFMA